LEKIFGKKNRKKSRREAKKIKKNFAEIFKIEKNIFKKIKNFKIKNIFVVRKNFVKIKIKK